MFDSILIRCTLNCLGFGIGVFVFARCVLLGLKELADSHWTIRDRSGWNAYTTLTDHNLNDASKVELKANRRTGCQSVKHFLRKGTFSIGRAKILVQRPVDHMHLQTPQQPTQ